MGIRNYRRHRLEMIDDGGEGWMVAIYPPDAGSRVVLRCHVPAGLPVLIEEAQARIDRRMDGHPCDRDP